MSRTQSDFRKPALGTYPQTLEIFRRQGHPLARASRAARKSRVSCASDQICDFGVRAVEGGEDACGCNEDFGRTLVVDGVESAAAFSHTVSLTGMTGNGTMRSDTLCSSIVGLLLDFHLVMADNSATPE